MMPEDPPRVEQQGLNGMPDQRVFTVPEVARFFGITPQAVHQRIVEGRLEACKVRVKGIAREYRISAEAIKEHYDMKRLVSETVRYRVGFMGWGLGLSFPAYQQEHLTYDRAVAEAKRVLAVLPSLQGRERRDGTLAARGFPSGARQSHRLPRPL